MPFVEGTPEEAGFDPARLDLVRRRLDEWIEAGDVHRTLVVLVARNGVVALHEAFGVTGPEPDAGPVTTDAIFPLMSQTKTITATLAMILAEDGRLGITRPVQEYLPEFHGTGKDQILVHHLLTHTSGIDGTDFYEATTRLVPQLIRNAAEPPPGEHVVTRLFLEIAYGWPASHRAGEAMRYADVNYLLLGEIIRRVAGQSLDEFARERLFEPLGMTGSSYGLPADRLDRYVGRSFDEAPEYRYMMTERGLGAGGGAGGAFGTASDLAAFTQLFLDGGRCGGHRILHPTTVEQMTQNQIPGLSAYMFDQRFGDASMGLGWLAASPEPALNWPILPSGSWAHSGTGFVYPWGDPSSGIVGVFCSVADRFRGPTSPDQVRHHGDLFVNMITAATVDDGV